MIAKRSPHRDGPAATTSVIVRITREALRPLMEADEALATRVWQGLAAPARGSLVLEPHEPLVVRAREPVRLVRLATAAVAP